jgi:hypothetical protein
MSVTTKFMIASTAMRAGPEKDAAAPTPSAHAAAPLPASVDATHVQGSCAASPTTGHAVAGAHAAGAALPPLQKKPAAQAVPELFAEPAAHAYPGAAAHGAHVDASTAPIAAENVPGPHGVGAAEPSGQYAPGGHAFATQPGSRVDMLTTAL